MKAPPSRTRRVLVSLAVALGGALLVLLMAHRGESSDLDQVLLGARALVAGADPYAVVGPGRAFPWPWPLYYPATTLVVVLPIAYLPTIVARALFAGVSSGLLAYALTRDGWYRLPLLLGMPMLRAVELAQWSPLVTAAVLLPGLSWLLLAAKPNLGLALWCMHPRRAPVIGGVLLLAGSLALDPHWPLNWLRALQGATAFHAPVTIVVGVPLVLAVLRWRRPEARLLLAMSCVPQTPLVYETVPLFLVPQTFRQALVLTILGGVGHLIVYFHRFPTYDAYAAAAAYWTTGLVYLPCLVMVLRRPNEGRVPGCLERAVTGATGAPP